MTTPIRWSRLSTPSLEPNPTWHHEPTRWAIEGDRLRLETDAPTDFWQRTHYEFQADNGHFLFVPVEGDAVVSTRLRFSGKSLYDQAGLMVRLSASCWLKTSVEYEPGRAGRLGAVVTNHGYSDWSTQPFTGDSISLRIRREGADYIVDASGDGRDWEQIRMAHLAEDDGQCVVPCGLYACSPKATGFVAEFEFLEIRAGRLSG